MNLATLAAFNAALTHRCQCECKAQQADGSPSKPLGTYRVQTNHGEFFIEADSADIVGISAGDAKLALYIKGEVVALFDPGCHG